MKRFDASEYHHYWREPIENFDGELAVPPDELRAASVEVELGELNLAQLLKNPLALFAVFSSSTPEESLLVIYCLLGQYPAACGVSLSLC